MEGRKTAARLAVGGFSALAIFAVLPHWLESSSAGSAPRESLHGTPAGTQIAYNGLTLGDAIDDLNSYSGERYVAVPELRRRSFSGLLPGPPDALSCAHELARQAHLQLVRAGPHWAFVAFHE